MRMPPLPADFTHSRACKPICEKSLTLPYIIKIAFVINDKMLRNQKFNDTECQAFILREIHIVHLPINSVSFVFAIISYYL